MSIRQVSAITVFSRTYRFFAIAIIGIASFASGCSRLKDTSNRREMVVGLAWIPNTNHFISAFENSLEVFDSDNLTTSLQQIPSDKSGLLTDVDVSADGKYVATSSLSGDVIVYEIKEELLGVEVTRYTHTNGVLSVTFSPDCKKVASSGRDGIVQIRTTNDFTKHFEFEHGINWIKCTAFSSDSNLLATGSWGGYVRLFDLTTKKELLGFQADNNAILSLAFLSDDNALVVASQGDLPLKVLESKSGEVMSLMDSKCSIRQVLVKDNSHFYTCGSDGSVRSWNLTGEELKVALSTAGWRTAICSSDDSRPVITGNIDGHLELIEW
jgi:WD40 repeat protein